ncbi:MAG: hypothetical protein V3R14_02390 [Nitrospinaceae bacterium]
MAASPSVLAAIQTKLLIQEGRTEEAWSQLLAVIQAKNPHCPYTWKRRFLQEAQHLLHDLPTHTTFSDYFTSYVLSTVSSPSTTAGF